MFVFTQNNNFLPSNCRVMIAAIAFSLILIFISGKVFATTYTSGTGSQATTTTVVAGVNDQEIIKVTLVAGGGGAALFRCRMDFTMQNTDNTDISNAKLYYTGTTNSFSTTTLLATVVNPTGTISFTFSHSTGAGTYYYWLAYDIKSSAPNCNVFDAQVAAIYAGASCPGTSQTVTTPNPTGDRMIEAPGCWKYCIPTGNLNCTVNDYIENVTINTLNNSTTCNAGGYTNFAATGAQTTTLTAGNSYTLSLTVGAGTGNHGAAVWIDFNNNGILTNSNEYFLISNSISPSTTSEVTINVPSGAIIANTRMRIRYIYNITVDSTMKCSSAGTYGETEDYTLTISNEMTYNSSVVTQSNTSGVTTSSSNNEIIGIQVVTIGNLNPVSATSFTFNTSGTPGTTAPSTDITNAKVWFTGTSSTFATTTQFGSTQASPNGAFVIIGSQALTGAAGTATTNYFWLTYDVPGGATNGNIIDASCSSIIVAGSTKTPAVTDPGGGRSIGPMTYQSSTCTQVITPTARSLTDQEIICIEVVTSGSISPVNVTSFTINTTGSTNAGTDIQSTLKIYYTSTSSTFSTGTLFGSGTTGAITGNQTLNTGTNYFWLAYDITAGATIGNVVDGECTSLVVAAISRTPAVTAPSGSRSVGTKWSGAISTVWDNAGNWNSGIPTSTIDAVIPAEPGNQPVINTTTVAICRDIVIKPSATLTINSTTGSLSFYGSIINNGTINHAGTGDILLYGTGKTLGGTGNFTTLQINVKSNADYTLSGDVTANDLIIEVNGSLSLNTSRFITTSSINQVGALNLNSGVWEVRAASQSYTAATLNHQTGTFYLNYNGSIAFNLTDDDYYNLQFGSQGNNGSTAQAVNNLHVANNVIIDANHTFNFWWSMPPTVILPMSWGGNWINNGTMSCLPNGSKITANGTSKQYIQGSQNLSFYNLEIDNSAGLEIQKKTTVGVGGTAGVLFLTNGIITTSSNELLVLEDGVTCNPTGGSATSFVDGPLKKIGDETFVFPIGNGTRWARLGITAPTIATTEYTAQYFANDPTADGYSSTSLAAGPPTLNNVSVKEYWTLDQAVNNDDVQVTLYWENNNFSRILDCDGTPDDLRLAHWNGSDWEINVDGVVLTGTCSGGTSGTMQSNAAQPTYSPMTFGSKTGINPLPVNLYDFSTKCDKDFIKCKWSSASEINNDYFILQKSFDAENWEHVAQIKGAGNSNEIKNYEYYDKLLKVGLIYYRLIQRDFDGKETVFNTSTVTCDTKDDFLNIVVFPNPAYSEINLLISSELPDEGKIYIYNDIGMCVYRSDIFIGNGTSRIKIDLAKLSIGSYYIKCVFDKHNPSEYKFVHLDK